MNISRNEQHDRIMQASPAELRELGSLAIGRLLNICSRPWRQGDDEDYAAVRSIILDIAESAGKMPAPPAPSCVADRLKGAAGD